MNLKLTLHIIIESLGYILPELCLALGAMLILVVELIFQNQKGNLKTTLNFLVLFLTAYLINANQTIGVSFDGILIHDTISTLFRNLFLIVVGFSLLFPKTKDDLRNKGEYHFLLLTLLLGAFFVIQSMNLLVFYLSLELISISSFILTTFSFKKKGYEAGIKYLLFGALSSGIMLYGISLLYGISGSLDLEVVVQTAFANPTTLTMLSLIFFSIGLLFKISLVPMHIWAPDVYEATPNAIIAVFSVVPKLAAIVFLHRVSTYAPEINAFWISLLSIIAIISMFIGNLSALWQSNAKRMMAYSSIAHAGFLLIGVIVHTEFALQSMMFYAIVYAIMNVGVFYFIQIMENNGLNKIEEYAGIGRKYPFFGVAVLIIMISLIGLPPTGGFTAKLLIFTSLWEYYNSTQSDYLLWLFVLGLINTVIALFYYLKIPYHMFVKKSDTEIELSIKNKFYLLLILTLILISFFKSNWLIVLF